MYALTTLALGWAAPTSEASTVYWWNHTQKQAS